MRHKGRKNIIMNKRSVTHPTLLSPVASACPFSGMGVFQHPIEIVFRLCMVFISPFPASCNYKSCTDLSLPTAISQPSFKNKVSSNIPQQDLCPFTLNSIGSYVSSRSSFPHHLMMPNYPSRGLYMHAHLHCAAPLLPKLAYENHLFFHKGSVHLLPRFSHPHAL